MADAEGEAAAGHHPCTEDLASLVAAQLPHEQRPDDGGQPDGNVSTTLSLRFVPTDGRMYLIGGRVLLFAGSDEGDSVADFGSTATVTRVRVPDGVSFVSASGTNWNVEVVPEPGPVSLAGASLATLALLKRRARARG